MTDPSTSPTPSDPATWNRQLGAQRTPFQKRVGGGAWRGRHDTHSLLEIRDAHGRPLPSLRDGWVRALLAFTLVLQLLVWTQVRGYSIADSVEFMERAQTLV